MIFILWLFIWLFSVVFPFLNGIYVLFLLIKLISYLEYEQNRVSSMGLARNLNILIRIEYLSHALVQIILLLFIGDTYLAILFNLPIFLYHLKKYF